MVLDVVCESIVQKRFEKSETIKAVAIAVGLIVVNTLLLLLIGAMPGISFLILLAMAGSFYLAFRLFTGLIVEYEYCFINGELTVDKIINKSSRKHLLSVDVKTIEKTGNFDYDKFNLNAAGHVINYSYSDYPAEAIFMQYRDGQNGLTTLIISPEDEFVKKMKPYFNQLVYREGFGR